MNNNEESLLCPMDRRGSSSTRTTNASPRDAQSALADRRAARGRDRTAHARARWCAKRGDSLLIAESRCAPKSSRNQRVSLRSFDRWHLFALIDDADSRRLAYLETRLPAARYGGTEAGFEETCGTDRCSSLEWPANLRTPSAPRVALAGPFDLLAEARRGFSRPLRTLRSAARIRHVHNV